MKISNILPEDELVGNWIGERTHLGYFGTYVLLLLLFYLSWPLAAILENYPLSINDASFWGQNAINLWFIFMLVGSWYLNKAYKEMRENLSRNLGSELSEILSSPYKNWIRLIVLVLVVLNTLRNVLFVIPAEASDPEIVGNTDIVLFSRFGTIVGVYALIIANTFNLIALLDIFPILWFVFVLPRRISSRRKKIDVLHPDRCGGLSSLSQFSLVFSLIGFFIVSYLTLLDLIFVLWFPMFLGRMQPGTVVLLVSCWSVVGFLFFWIQWSTHLDLKHTKEKHTNQLMNRIRDHEVLEENLDFQHSIVVLQLFRVYDEIRSMSEWPFDVGTLRKFVLSAILSISLQILAAIIGFTQ